MSVKYSLINDGDSASITVYVDGNVLTATDTHPNFETIVEQVLDGDVDVELFDVSVSVATKFDRLSERVTVAGGHVYFDGDEQSGPITDQIIRFLDEGHDFMPLVHFMEKVAQNPNDHSREQLFSWMENHGFTIDKDGYIIAYKGVHRDGDGSLVSCTSGPAIVNGEAVNGNVPNPVGAIVEMPRSSVVHDPRQGCGSGLHVANWRYADGFGNVTLKVKVHPRDVVSVPTDSSWEKMRVCRYTVLEEVSAPVDSALDVTEGDDDDVYDAPVTVTVPVTENEVSADIPPLAELRKMTTRELRSLAQRFKVRVKGRRPSHCKKPELVRGLNALASRLAKQS